MLKSFYCCTHDPHFVSVGRKLRMQPEHSVQRRLHSTPLLKCSRRSTQISKTEDVECSHPTKSSNGYSQMKPPKETDFLRPYDISSEIPCDVFDSRPHGILLQSSGNTSFNQAVLNAVNILLGVGLLSIPYALAQGGWIALLVLALLGIATNHTGKLLGTCQERLCLVHNRPANESQLVAGLGSYEEIGEAAFGKLGRAFITSVLYVELVGTCGLFFILEGDNLSRLFGGNPQTYMWFSALLLLPTTWLSDLSSLAALGALGAIASASMLGVVLYTFCTEGFPQGPGQVLAHLDTLPYTFGLLSFVFAGHAVFPNIKASMKEPELYPKMLDYTYIIVGGICSIIGIVGYQMYGIGVMQEITLNLPPGAVAIGATSLIVINPFTKFALTLEPVARGFEEILVKLECTDSVGSRKLDPILRILARTSLGAVALILATSVPAFASVMALIGSCLTLIVSVIFPSMAYLSLFGKTVSPIERLWNYVVMVIGCVCAVSGTYTAMASLH